ncbi:MAG TPA: IS200/IS605 family transposase [Pyrinomonadaceae bacterium]
MPWIKVWLHFVWCTKERFPFLQDGIRTRVFEHIRENAISKKIHIDFLNGWVEHVHCLVSLGSDQTLEKLMQLIKGESSFWINKNHLTKKRFEWQDEYFVASVSESNVASVRRYIARQDEHHSKVSFDQEFEIMLRRAGFQRYKDLG